MEAAEINIDLEKSWNMIFVKEVTVRSGLKRQ
jgi:hypothetical protein